MYLAFAALVLLFVFCVQPNYAIDILEQSELRWSLSRLNDKMHITGVVLNSGHVVLVDR